MHSVQEDKANQRLQHTFVQRKKHDEMIPTR